MATRTRKKNNSAFCADCYGNNPYGSHALNPDILAYQQLYKTKCGSCEPSCTEFPSPGKGKCCNDPEHSGIYVEGCIEGDGTHCNPLRLKAECGSSGDCDCVTGCTLQVGSGCCDYSVEGIELCIPNYLVYRVEFDSAALNADLALLTRQINTVSIRAFGEEINIGLPPPGYTTVELMLAALEAEYNSNPFTQSTVSFFENGFEFISSECGSSENYLGSFFFITVGQIGSVLPNVMSNYITFTVATESSIIKTTDKNSSYFVSAIFDNSEKRFQILINDVWTDVTDEVTNGTWQRTNVCDDVITEWRIIDSEENVINSGDVTATCEEATQVTKSLCEWISYHEERLQQLESEPSGIFENIYTSDGTIESNRNVEGNNKSLSFQNLRYFALEAQPEDNDIYGIALGNAQSGEPSSLAGVLIGGKGKNQGVVISGITRGDNGAGTSGVQITGENSEPSGDDIIITPQNEKLRIQNIPTDTPVYTYGQNTEGRLIKFESSDTEVSAVSQLVNDSGYITSAALNPLAFFSGSAGHTGNTDETIVQTRAIPSTAWATNAVYQILARVTRIAGSLTFRVRFNTTPDLTGTPVTILEFATSAGSSNTNRLLIKTGNSFEYSTLTTISDLTVASTTATATVSTASTTYIMLTIQGSTNAANGNFSMLNISRQ